MAKPVQVVALKLTAIRSCRTGSSVTTLEIKLSEALVRCAEWDAVLLLDEADVFLEARTTDSLQRNEMISSRFTLNFLGVVRVYPY